VLAEALAWDYRQRLRLALQESQRVVDQAVQIRDRLTQAIRDDEPSPVTLASSEARRMAQTVADLVQVAAEAGALASYQKRGDQR
jgi:hypothetical protein